jgi:hypothetical protein
MTTLKLNDLLFSIKENLKMYSYTSNIAFFNDAKRQYKEYKERKGKRIIERLEES